MRPLRIAIAAVLVFASAIRAVTVPPAPARDFDAANNAWERGDYSAALTAYIQLLNTPAGDKFLEPIALTTGELFRTRELTTDGRAPRFSPDGRFIVYETGLETSRRTKVLKNDASRAEVADLPGVWATFSPLMGEVAYLRIPDPQANEEIRRASEAIENAALTAQNRNQLTQMLTWLIARDAAIVVRDLLTGREMELPTPDLLKTGLTFSGDGRLLYFLGGKETEPDRTDVYVISEAAPRPLIAADAGGLKGVPTLDSSGKLLLYVIPVQNPFRRPVGAGGAGGAGEASGASRAGGAGEAGGAGRAGGAEPAQAPQPTTFAILNVATRNVSVVAGTAPSLSADGKTLAYVGRSESDYTLMIGPALGAQTAVKRTSQPLDAPALSADGSRVAFQMMPVDDWEIFVANRDGSAERRITWETQHDLQPRFIGSDRLLAVIGEPRHRRSYLYELAPDTDRVPARVRLFHNNTVRTIAPEYQWSVSPDGTQMLVGADRDGNTVSPERGVYAIDLQRTVTKHELIDRLGTNLKHELALKAAGARAFQPIAASVRQVLARMSVARIFGYEKALFDFGSKHITKPGNRQASEFLFNTYKSFGYTPEYQWFDPSAKLGAAASPSSDESRTALGGTTANVVATLRGTLNPELVYLVSSHYDSVAAGPGADDDTSGTAALLEAARVLAEHPMPATIVFASFTGEESGLLGSREFVRRASASGMHVVGALNNDMIGWRNDQRLDNTIRYSNAGIRDIQHAAAFLFTRLITYDALYFKGTDAVSLYDAYGDIVGGIGSYPVLGSPHYHQASDLLEFEDHRLITETSKTTVATLMLLASSPSRLTNLKVDRYTGSSAALSWTASPEKGVTTYIVAFGPPSDPLRRRVTVLRPRVTLPRIAPGSVVSVKAVNARGLEGWDWAKVKLPDAAPTSTTPGAASAAPRPGTR